MQVTVPALFEKEVTLNITESDMEVLREIVDDAFLAHIQFCTIDKDRYFSPQTDKIVHFCEKYGINPYLPEYRLAFFRALLGRNKV
jgi:hypothetical protein